MANRTRGAMATGAASRSDDGITLEPTKAVATPVVDPRKPRRERGWPEEFIGKTVPSLSLHGNRQSAMWLEAMGYLGTIDRTWNEE